MPIKARLTLIFVLAMALVLAAAGLFVYLRFRAELNASIDATLRSRAAQVASLVAKPPSSRGRVESLGGVGETIAEIVDSKGRLVAGTRGFTSSPLVKRGQLPPRGSGAAFINAEVPDAEGATRFIVEPAAGSGGALYAVAGASLSDRDDALSDLLTPLVIGGLAALALASVAGYRLAAGALRPVEAMRSRAAEISHLGGGRLPVSDRSDEIGRLGTTLNEMLARLDAAIEHERQFIADASHELRSPLTILRGELELAREDERSVAELRAAVASAADETDRLCRLADDMLLIARSQDGELPLRVENLDTDDLLSSIARRFAAQAKDRDRAISVGVRGDPALRGDRTRLEQAIGNLVDNALRHGAGEISLSSRSIDGIVRIAVHDGGAGFPPGFIDRAFERFSRADKGRGESGTGLGLAIVEMIARAHGGTAAVANDPGGGASAWIELPTA
jgi:signal transduction histidine kinase